MSSQHVFPLILDGPVQALTNASASKAWDGLTSYITAASTGASFTVTLGAAKQPGTIVTVIKTQNPNNVTVDPTTDFDSGSVASIILGSANESVSFLWNGSSWRLFTQDQTNSTEFDGGDVANATTFEAAVEFEGNVGFYDTTPIAQRASADQAAVAAAAGLPADGTDAGATYTQAEVSAAFDTIYDLITLVNRMRADLVALGLIKGSA